MFWIKANKQNSLKTEASNPVVFQNQPITDEKEDLFGFNLHVKALQSAINGGASIIGVMGDYGSGKSSLTELLKTKIKNAYFESPISINLWNRSKSSQNKESIDISIKSFLYQLALGNDKKNNSFARYINHRLSNNYGKLSISMSINHWWGIIPVLVFILYFVTLKIKALESFYIPYVFLVISIISLFIMLINGNILFSLWDSQGKIEPDSADIFEIYKEIMEKRIPKRKKRIIFIEDLDRSKFVENTEFFLKELYKFHNLLSKEQKQKNGVCSFFKK